MDLFYFVFVFVILSYLCHTALLAPAGKRTDFLALLYVMFSCVSVTFPYAILGQVCYLIVSIPDLCILPYVFGGKCKLIPKDVAAELSPLL